MAFFKKETENPHRVNARKPTTAGCLQNCERCSAWRRLHLPPLWLAAEEADLAKAEAAVERLVAAAEKVLRRELRP